MADEEITTQQSRISLAKLEKASEEALLPLAYELGLIGASVRLQDLAGCPSAEDDDWPTAPKQIAIEYLLVCAHSLAIAKAMQKNGPLSWELFAERASIAASQAQAYMYALKDSNQNSTKHAANGRIALGEKTLEQIKIAAEPFRGIKTRDAAATLVAAQVNKSPSYVRTKLSNLFPGDTWKKP